MNLKQLVSEKEKNYKRVPDELINNIQKSEKEIYGKLIELLNKLKRGPDDRIIISKENIAIAADITNQIKGIVITKDYLTALKKFIDAMDKQAVMNDKYFKNALPGFQESESADAVLEKTKQSALEILIGAPMQEAFITPLISMIDTAVSSGETWTDLTAHVKEFVIGNG